MMQKISPKLLLHLRSYICIQKLLNMMEQWQSGNFRKLKVKKLRHEKTFVTWCWYEYTYLEWAYTITHSRTVETTFLGQFWNSLLFSRKQQQIFIICWQISYSDSAYPIALYNRWYPVSGKISKLAYFLVLSNKNISHILLTVSYSEST